MTTLIHELENHIIERRVKMIIAYTIILMMLFSLQSMGQNDPSHEAKADYLLRIYFSGQNKDGIVKDVLVTIQELEEKISNPSLSDQYSFLYEMQDKLSQADNTCDALDLLSIGIYS